MKHSHRLLLGTIFVTLGLGTACSKKDSSEAPQHKGYVSYEGLANFELIQNAKLSDGQKKISEKVAKGEKVEFELLTNELIAMHYREAKTQGELKDIRETTSRASIKMLADHVTGLAKLTSKNMGEFKVKYEDKLEDMHNRSLIYNSKKTNINDIIYEGRMQCYSGTYLNQVTLRKYVNHVNQFDELNSVVIYESGHVLPGFISKDKDNDWQLTGIETTVGGKAQKIYGKVKSLDGALRIVLAHDFALSEIFKGLIKTEFETATTSGSSVKVKDNPVACLSKIDGEMVTRAANKFSIPIAKLEKNIRIQEGCPRSAWSTNSNNTALALNASTMGFGKSNTHEGDITRPVVDEISGGLAIASGPSIFNKLRAEQNINDKKLFGQGQCVFNKNDHIIVSTLDPRACAMFNDYNERYHSKEGYIYAEWALFPPVRMDMKKVRKLKSMEEFVTYQEKLCEETYAGTNLKITPMHVNPTTEDKTHGAEAIELFPYSLHQGFSYKSKDKDKDDNYDYYHFKEFRYFLKIKDLYKMFGAEISEQLMFIESLYNMNEEYKNYKQNDSGLRAYYIVYGKIPFENSDSDVVQQDDYTPDSMDGMMELSTLSNEFPAYALCIGHHAPSKQVRVREFKRGN
ncbi:MAG: hypothetical protein KDD58_14590 [Bdellovibrionales bacterium]|nr:hypothetical protein [Bdellovibrionales bacterium]